MARWEGIKTWDEEDAKGWGRANTSLTMKPNQALVNEIEQLKKKLVPAATASLHKLLQSSGGGKATGGKANKPSAATLLAICTLSRKAFLR